MTKEELKKKIVEIIINAIWKDAEADYDSTDETEARSIAEALIAAGIGDVSEWKHRAKRAEKTMIRLAEKYVDAAKINTIKDVNGKIYFAERQACVTYVEIGRAHV